MVIPKPNTNVKGGMNSRPASGFGRWVYSTQSFKALLDASKSTSLAEPPFQKVILNGSKAWQNSGTYGDNSRLKLIMILYGEGLIQGS